MTTESSANTLELIMPQIGEGITHVTIKKWLKQAGDFIEKDENILEVFSDKIDIVVQSTDSGILQKQLVGENEELKIKTPYAILSSKPTDNISIDSYNATNENAKIATSKICNNNDNFYSPLIKSIIKQENISDEELNLIKGSGKDGRIVKDDIIDYINSKKTDSSSVKNQTKDSNLIVLKPKHEAGDCLDANSKIIKMDSVRKLIATNMIRSKQISPHVASVVEADVTKIVEWKNDKQKKFMDENGLKLTFTPIFTEAVAKALLVYPIINSSVDNDNIILHKDINIGIATALPNGNLIVPVIKKANEKNIIGLAKEINDLASRARKNNLSHSDISQGTFTITNMAPFNNILAFPIIKQPEVAILAIGKITKRVVVTNENTIAIRDIVYLTLTYDHRIIDGAAGGKFLSYLADLLKNFEQQ